MHTSAPGDDELNGAAAALLGLHSSARSTSPPPRSTSPASVLRPALSTATTTSRAPPTLIPLTKHHTYPNPWNGSFHFSPPTTIPPVVNRARSVNHQQEPRAGGFVAPGGNDHAYPSYHTTTAVTAAASAAQGQGRGLCFELPFQNHADAAAAAAAAAASVSASEGRFGSSEHVPQDPSIRRNNFLGISFADHGDVSAGAMTATATATADGGADAATAWMKPPGAARQQQQQRLLTLRPSASSFSGSSSSRTVPQTTAPWPLPHPAATVSPVALVMARRHHQQQQHAAAEAAARERPARRTSISPSRVSPPARILQQQIVCGPVLRAERNIGVRWTWTTSGDEKGHGRPVPIGPAPIGQDMLHTVRTPTSVHRQQLPPPAPRSVQPRQQNVQQQQQQVWGTTQHQDKQSLNHLWRLIPGNLVPGALQRRSPDLRGTDENRKGYEPDQPGMSFLPGGKQPRGLVDDTACGRWYSPDVHPPLSDVARYHRARAVSRLRARRRALAAATATATATVTASSALPKASSLARFSSSTSNVSTDSSDSGGGGGGGGMGENNDHNSGGERASNSSCCEKAVDAVAKRRTDTNDGGAAVSGGGDSGDGIKAGGVGVADEEGGNGGGQVVTGASNNNSTPNFLELMWSVNANVLCNNRGAGAGDVNGCDSAIAGDASNSEKTSGESRELGKPVKYKYRQIAARSRKRTRGRFVSEKAPAFVPITELMARRRAKRERQQQEVPAAPVVVVSGVGAG